MSVHKQACQSKQNESSSSCYTQSPITNCHIYKISSAPAKIELSANENSTKIPQISDTPHCLNGVLITPLSEGTSSGDYSPAREGRVTASCGTQYDEEDPLPKVKPKVQCTQYTKKRGGHSAGHCATKERKRTNTNNTYKSALTLATLSNKTQPVNENGIPQSMNTSIHKNQGSITTTNCNGSRMYVIPNGPLTSMKNTHCCNGLNNSRNMFSLNETVDEGITPFINAEHPIVNRITLAFFNGDTTAEVSERADIMLTPHTVTYVSAPTTSHVSAGSLCTPTSSGRSAGRMSHR